MGYSERECIAGFLIFPCKSADNIIDTERKEAFLMGMMDGIAAQAMSMNSAEIAQNYSIAVAKKTMDTQELAAQELLEMLPQTPAVAKGQYIDVYA